MKPFADPVIADDIDSGAALDPQAFAAVCKALGHPARVRIVAHLMAIDRCICGQIVDILPLAQSTVSQHLKQLKEAGLVQGEVEGPRTCYCLNRSTWERFKESVNLLHGCRFGDREESK
jgi:DNA-binding transcriptional ArsR family regulator